MATAAVTYDRFPHAENGQKIARARQLLPGRRGPLSQSDFAALVGLSERHLIRIENGERLPSAETRDRIVTATGTTEEIAAFDDEDEESRMYRDLLSRFKKNLDDLPAKRTAGIVLTVAAVALGLAATAQASPPIPQMSFPAVTAASDAAGKPIVIVEVGAGPVWVAQTWAGSSVITLSPRAYRLAASGAPLGIFTLLHEAGHATGISDEGAADCFALAHFRAALPAWHLNRRQRAVWWRDALAINRDALKQKPYGCAA